LRILVAGGAGYIGSHMAHHLIDSGHSVVVADNLSTGVRELVPHEADFVEVDLRDTDRLRKVMQTSRLDAVLHFAASTVVPESVAGPLDYYANNVGASLSLLQAMVGAGVPILIFSSTAAVYGIPPDGSHVTEDSPADPVSPYGASKLMAERIVKDAASAHGLRYGILRYFNVAGADPQGRTGQSTPHATHLIKVACEVATGRREHLTVFGTDYPTPDGTGVRDYIHVWDLVELHRLSLDHLAAGGDSLLVNCGYSRGHSVNEVVRAVERVSGKALAVTTGARRPGDVAVVVAAAERAREILGWTPQHEGIDQIVRDALAWERRFLAADDSAIC
jgi:UDP-glucose 4-epimerase